MKQVARLAKAKLNEWNKRVYTEADLTAYCLANRVVVVEESTPFCGEYTIFEGRDCIILDPDLKGGNRTFVFAHEVGHQILHHPIPQRFCATENLENLFVEKLDFQANFVAAIALIPIKDVRAKRFWEIVDEYNYPKQLLEFRKEIFERYKL